jgi:hypothetical protein
MNEKAIILRYGTNIVADCIEKHQEVTESTGYCWFGKIGTVPSDKVINTVLDGKNPKIILYSKGIAYICDFTEIKKDKPASGIPEYYQEYLYDQLIIPKIYFKLTCIEKLDAVELSKYRVCSSQTPVMETLNRSMSSFFFVEKGELAVEYKPEKKAKSKKETKVNAPNSCKYKKDGKCNNKACISYLYECERPSMCMKQKL